jgi:hypothetical protein
MMKEMTVRLFFLQEMNLGFNIETFTSIFVSEH